MKKFEAKSLDVRRWCSRSGGTQSGNARSVAAEGEAVVGHGDGGAVSLPLLERHLIVQHLIL